MHFDETKLKGSYVVKFDQFRDERGHFGTTFCKKEFDAAGLDGAFLQANVSFNLKRGTLRGMHFQIEPAAQTKLVRCVRGAIFDVMIDLRSDSPTFCQWVGAELTAERGDALYVPKGFAHGFMTLADDTEVFYQMGGLYEPSLGRGVRWNDPAFAIQWPLDKPILNDRDANYPDFKR